MGDLDARTFLVTGANTGIGRATTQALAARGATVVLAGRSEARTRTAITEITALTGNDRLTFLALDLGDLASVRQCAQAFAATGQPLHCLINNAGLAGQRGQHPGVVASDVWRRVPWPIRPLMKLRMLSLKEGALTSLYCAAAPGAAMETGLYYEQPRPKRTGPPVTPQLAAALWAYSEDRVAGNGSV